MPQLRYRSPFLQVILCGICIAFSAGIYVSLNLLGAGGGRPSSAHVIQIVNATLCAVWFLSSSFGGSILNLLGPGPTMSGGVLCYVVYVGSLWYYDETGNSAFPFVAGVVIGIGSGMVFIAAGYIQLAYPEEKEKGMYITMVNNIQAMGSVIGGIIPLIINRNSTTSAGVPRAVYISYIVIMVCAAFLGLLILPPQKLRRDDGSVVAVYKARPPWEELKDNLLIFTDWRLMIMLPAFLSAESFLVYVGAVNVYHNDLRARCLLGFMAALLQIPFGFALQLILDHQTWSRKKRGLIGLTCVAIPIFAAWIWEIVRVRNYKRHNMTTNSTDWIDPDFGWIFVLFVLTWVSCTLWHSIIYYFLGALTNNPIKLAHYAGVYRGVMGAGEAICFGVDSLEVPFIKEAAVIFAVYATGIAVYYFLGLTQIEESNYFKGEEGVVVPNHVLREKGLDGEELATVNGTLAVAELKK